MQHTAAYYKPFKNIGNAKLYLEALRSNRAHLPIHVAAPSTKLDSGHFELHVDATAESLSFFSTICSILEWFAIIILWCYSAQIPCLNVKQHG